MNTGINSRGIDDLHPTLARGCREFIRQMNEAGFAHVGISSTFRCGIHQDHLFAQGRTRPGNIVTSARAGQSIHNYRLAFDFFQNIRGQEWNNVKFFETGGRIWREMGGVWGGDWRTPDRPHCEFTNGLRWQDLQAGQMIPEDFKMAWEHKKAEETIEMIYRTVEEMPTWAQPGIQELIDMRVLNGRAPDNLDVDENMMRILLVVRNMFDRAGLLEKIAANVQ